MYIIQKIERFYFRKRGAFNRRKRLLFPSPAELRFIQIMGGRYIAIKHIRDPKTGFPLAVIITMGRKLRREAVAREVRVGKCYVDFGIANSYYKKGIEIDGRNFHQDIIREHARDEYCRQYGWALLHIQAADLYLQPDYVQRRVLQFLK